MEEGEGDPEQAEEKEGGENPHPPVMEIDLSISEKSQPSQPLARAGGGGGAIEKHRGSDGGEPQGTRTMI